MGLFEDRVAARMRDPNFREGYDEAQAEIAAISGALGAGEPAEMSPGVTAPDPGSPSSPDADIAAGRVTYYDSSESFLESLL